MNSYKYIYNIRRGTLHLVGCSSATCLKSDPNWKFYKSEDKCYKENQTHFRKCKKCLGGK